MLIVWLSIFELGIYIINEYRSCRSGILTQTGVTYAGGQSEQLMFYIHVEIREKNYVYNRVYLCSKGNKKKWVVRCLMIKFRCPETSSVEILIESITTPREQRNFPENCRPKLSTHTKLQLPFEEWIKTSPPRAALADKLSIFMTNSITTKFIQPCRTKSNSHRSEGDVMASQVKPLMAKFRFP